MKAILKFNLDDVDDRQNHLRCVKATDMSLVLWEFMRNSRKSLEDSMKEGEDYYAAIEKTYSRMCELLDEFDVSLDKIID
jgi:hypothetical protein